jgi:diguanylate cyclase (GGDEF)-like protein
VFGTPDELDPLTGVHNRRAVFRRLEALQPGESVAGIGIDVRGFRGVNDELGHVAGDKLLVNVARRLAGATYTGDVVSRLVGSEFAVLAYCVAGDSDELEMLTREIADALMSEPVELASDSVDVRASISCAMLESVDDLGLLFPGD